MKRLSHKISIIAILISIAYSGIARPSEDVELSKRYVRSFKVSPNVQVDLSNKYGDIIVNTWDKDSVSFNIKITAFGKNDESVDKLIERVSFDHTNSGKFLKFETIFDRQSGSFKEFWNSLGDYSKVLINKNNLNIDYEIFIPKKSNMYLENKFGDIYINEYAGRSKILLSQGDIKISNQSGQLNLDLKFGNASIQSTSLAYLNLQIAEVTIAKAGKLDISSSSSTVNIHEVDRLKIDSRNDKYYLRNVGSLSGEATFSNVNISNLKEEIMANANYSDLNIESFAKEGKIINLNTKSTDIKIWVDSENAYDLDLIAKEDRLEIPLEWKSLKSYYTDSKNKYLRISGQIKTENPAQIHIDNQGGSLSIFEK